LNIAKLALIGLLILAAGCATRRTPAPVVDAKAPKPAAVKPAASTPGPPRAGGDYYTVKRGDTLYSIALEHGADYRDLAQWNSLDDPTKLRVGQQLRMRTPEGEPRAQVGPARIVVGRLESRPLESRPLEPPPPSTPKAPPAVVTVNPDPIGFQFIWPVKGKVLAGFADPRNKGIDIDGKPGDPVVAAASGRVTYMGTGIPGLGKLVVIKHDNGYITVYAHNREILVKEQQSVVRGQKIAELGTKLHFQIRKGASAVDPLLYLPRS
jgi:lipoprotein NlpD